MQSEQLLMHIFLLTVENQNLRMQLNNQHYQGNQRNEQNGQDLCGYYGNGEDGQYVLKRIQLIQGSMGKELRFKEEKIGELNQHIREIHGLNQRLSSQLQILKINHKNLQEVYITQISEYKKKLLSLSNPHSLPHPHPYPTHSQSHQQILQILQNEKQQLSSQLQRLTKITLKQLETDLQILTKENRSYMLSINGYRNQLKNQRSFYEDQRKKWEEEREKFGEVRIGLERNLGEMRVENQKLKAKCQQIEKQHSQTLQKYSKQTNDTLQTLQQAVTTLQQDLTTSTQKLKKCSQQLQKKSKKLKEYDDQYSIYLGKMNNLVAELNSLKQENTRIREKFQGELQGERRKSKEVLGKLEDGYQGELKKLGMEYQQKLKNMQANMSKQTQIQTKKLLTQLTQLRDQYQTTQKTTQQKLSKIQKQRDNAIRQWEELLNEMSKQKNIIMVLEKDIQAYRRKFVGGIGGCEGKVEEKEGEKGREKGREKEREREGIVDGRKFRVESQRFGSEKEESNREYHQRMKSQLHEKFEPEEQENYLQRIQKLKDQAMQRTKNTFDIGKQNTHNAGGQSTRRKSFGSTTRQSNEKPNYSSVQYPRSKSITSTNQRYTTQQAPQPQFETPSNHLHPPSKQLPLSHTHTHTHSLSSQYHSTQLQRPSLSSKRKDGSFKKYEYLRTKTQENIQSNYQYIPRNRVFFEEKGQGQGQGEVGLKARAGEDLESFRDWNRNTELGSGRTGCGEKLMRASSLEKGNYDKNLGEIQQYLSFNLDTVKKMVRSASDHKLKEPRQSQRESLTSQATLYDSIPSKNLLLQKINNIGSARQQHQITKQSKFYNFWKKPQPPTRPPKQQKLPSQKQNLNQIIQRKCKYITEI